MSVYKFENEPCKICSKRANICVRNGDAIILDAYKWDLELNEWVEIMDWSTSGLEFAYFCEECYEGVREDIGKRRYFK